MLPLHQGAAPSTLLRLGRMKSCARYEVLKVSAMTPSRDETGMKWDFPGAGGADREAEAEA